MGSVVPFEISRMPKRRQVPMPMPRAAADVIILEVVQHVRPAQMPADPRPPEQAAQKPL